MSGGVETSETTTDAKKRRHVIDDGQVILNLHVVQHENDDENTDSYEADAVVSKDLSRNAHADHHNDGPIRKATDLKKPTTIQTSILVPRCSQKYKLSLQAQATEGTFDARAFHEKYEMRARATAEETAVPDPSAVIHAVMKEDVERQQTRKRSASLLSSFKHIENHHSLDHEMNLDEESSGRRIGVYPAGAHTHDIDERYWILTKKRVDAAGRKPSDPLFDRRTMRLPSEWSQVETSPVQLQWWHTKARFADCLLFFKIGRFYEMYHTDADVGVEHAGLVYMKGEQAHCGFPEQAYGKYLDMLVKKGFKIARIEQTETPERNKERIARVRRSGHKPDRQEQAMRREVCSLTTPSTRCYTYLDLPTTIRDSFDGTSSDASSAAETSKTRTALLAAGDGGGACGMPSEPKFLVAIKRGKERTVCREDEKDAFLDSEICELETDSHLRGVAHCHKSQQSHRYGVCVVDCARGSFVLAEFDDDAASSTRLRTMLNEFPPAEVLLERSIAADLPDLVRCACADSLAAHSCVETLTPGEEFWDAKRMQCELHRILPRSSNARAVNEQSEARARWPEILKLAVENEADLCVSSLGAATWWLRRSLIEVELLSMGNFDNYTPPDAGLSRVLLASRAWFPTSSVSSPTRRTMVAFDEATLVCAGVKVRREERMRNSSIRDRLSLDDELVERQDDIVLEDAGCELLRIAKSWERAAPRMAMDAAALRNLHVLESGAVDRKTGSLWGLVQPGVSTAMGSRRLRSWLVRPLADPRDIMERAGAVKELVRRPATVSKLVKVLKKVPDLERLMQQIHTLGSARRAPKRDSNDDDDMNQHPDARAVLFDAFKFNGKKVQQLVDAIQGLKESELITEPPDYDSSYEAEDDNVRYEIECPSSDLGSGGCWRPRLLKRCCTFLDEQANETAGCFPVLARYLEQFEEGFDLQTAKLSGKLEPRRGSDNAYDDAVDDRDSAERGLKQWLLKERKMRRCAGLEYVTTAKDKYCVRVPDEAFGRGRPFETLPDDWTQRSKTKKSRVFDVRAVKPLLGALEDAESRVTAAKLDQLRSLFFAFDRRRNRWGAAVACIATLDALLALAKVSQRSGFCQPTFVAETSGDEAQQPRIRIKNGAHPCLDVSLATSVAGGLDVIGNDLDLGTGPDNGPVLILSGPNMGGKYCFFGVVSLFQSAPAVAARQLFSIYIPCKGEAR
mmetsp:Transcript_12409/g.40551  ORF Transcript_12409/g.40551 Transcript_12409/m.40551 type:complete len:1195 (+) Transcript_12409:258-3842(+)